MPAPCKPLASCHTCCSWLKTFLRRLLHIVWAKPWGEKKEDCRCEAPATRTCLQEADFVVHQLKGSSTKSPAFLADFPLENLRNCIRYFLADDEYKPEKESFRWLYSLDWTLMLAQQDLHGLPLLTDSREFVCHSQHMVISTPRHANEWLLMGELASAAVFVKDWDHMEWLKLRLEMLRALKTAPKTLDLHACD